MTRAIYFFLFVSLMSLAAVAQTARDYYKELHEAKGLNPLLMFVCFPEPDTGKFDTIALTRTFNRTITDKHLPSTTKSEQMFAKSDMLYLQTFYKGVAREPQLLDKQDKASDLTWVLSTMAVIEGHRHRVSLTYTFNWQTLRYEDQITVGGSTAHNYGKCEPIQ
jgi:hypothetical protein